MKSIVGTIVLVLVMLPFSFADEYIYDSPYGGKKVGKIDEDGVIYDSPYGGSAVGRTEQKDGSGYWLLKE